MGTPAAPKGAPGASPDWRPWQVAALALGSRRRRVWLDTLGGRGHDRDHAMCPLFMAFSGLSGARSVRPPLCDSQRCVAPRRHLSRRRPRGHSQEDGEKRDIFHHRVCSSLVFAIDSVAPSHIRGLALFASKNVGVSRKCSPATGTRSFGSGDIKASNRPTSLNTNRTRSTTCVES